MLDTNPQTSDQMLLTILVRALAKASNCVSRESSRSELNPILRPRRSPSSAVG
jgi:hypothetical protein